MTDARNNYYVGHIKSGKRDGLGTMKYANGDLYQGFWQNDLKDGEGS
jgi:1-phosphatidylinositol-4-phosphate 5-kinase